MRKILTLEDEFEINDFYKDLFEEYGYTVTSVSTYEEAMDIVQGEKIDLLIVDHLLQYSQSSKNGLETAREIKKITPDIKIIMISAHYPDQEKAEYERHGINLLMKKPFNINELLEEIRHLCPDDGNS